MLDGDRGTPAQRLVREFTLGLLESAISAASLGVATTSGTAAYRRVPARHGHHVRLAAGVAAAFTGGVLTDGLLDIVTAGARLRLNDRGHASQAHRAEADAGCHPARMENTGLAPQQSGEKTAAVADHASPVGDGQAPLAAAPRVSKNAGEASGGEKTAGVPDKSPPVPGDEEDGGAASSSPPECHDVVVQGLLTKAAAVRYAIKALDSTHTPRIVKWLEERGRTVNRGQAYRITKAAAAERKRSRTLAVTTVTPPQ